MLTYEKLYDSLHNSITNVCRHLDVNPKNAIKIYFGIKPDVWMREILLKVDPVKYRLDNYGRSKEWIICHQYWRELATIKDSGLPVELLLNYEMWQPKPVMAVWTGASEISRQDYIVIRGCLNGFKEVYRTLFVTKENHREKCSEINKLVYSLLHKRYPMLNKHRIKLLFHELNHTVTHLGHNHYYQNLCYIN